MNICSFSEEKSLCDSLRLAILGVHINQFINSMERITMVRGFTFWFCALALTAASIGVTNDAEAARKRAIGQVCKKVTTLPNGGYIYKNSAPLRSGGIGTPLIGYRNEPTLIMNGRTGSSGGTTIYDKAGKKIGSCPWASAHGHAGGRYRCTMNTASLRRSARKNTGSPEVYFKLRGNSCVKVPDAGRCYGSVKGRCNQLIA